MALTSPRCGPPSTATAGAWRSTSATRSWPSSGSYLHEDDALRAARCALEMRAALTALNRELEPVWGVTLHARYGLSTGEVALARVGAHPFFALGDAVNVAQRLESAAPADEVLINRQTARLLGGIARLQQLDPLTLKGKSEPVPAWRLVELLPADEAAATRRRRAGGTRPGAGRPARDAGRRAGRAALPSGHRPRPAGVGKSCLVRRFLADAEASATTAFGRCLPYGEGITFWPLAESSSSSPDGPTSPRSPPSSATTRRHDGPPRGLRSRSGSHRRRADRGDPAGVAPAPGGSGTAAPALLVVEDIHWAEPTLLDVLEHVASPRAGRPAVPGLPGAPRAADPPTRSPVADTVRLAPLSEP